MNTQNPDSDNNARRRVVPFWCKRLAAILLAALASFQIVAAQEPGPTPPNDAAWGGFRVGERLTYDVSFGGFSSVAFAETSVVSGGKLEGRDAVELRMRIKTTEFFGAAFYFVDLSRSTFAAVETGLPLFVRNTSREGGLPKSTVRNYLDAPVLNYDLLSMLYRARQSGGAGSFTLE